MALQRLVGRHRPWRPEAVGSPPPHRANNLDALRLAAAGMVLLSHQFALTRLPHPTVGGIDVGTLGVSIFFVLSGMLVTRSWQSDPHLLRFAARRLLRIWPALALCVLVTALVVGPWLGTLAPADYFASDGLYAFVWNNLRFRVVYTLPGVFESNPYPGTVNGSLWTIPIEVMCYACIALVGLLGVLARGWMLPVLAACLACWLELRAAGVVGQSTPGQNLKYGLLLVFLIGACAQRSQALWMARPLPWVLACVAVSAAALAADRVFWATSAGAVLVVCWAYRSATPWLRRAGRFGDLSYGLYIYGFLVQQSLLSLGMATWGLAAGFAAALVVSLACAWVSWHAVERPALRYKPRTAAAPGSLRANA